MDFNGKVVLITGASSGIGADAAIYFSSLGAKLSLTGRNEVKLEKTIKGCKDGKKGAELIYIVGDMSKEDDVKNILSKTIDKYGRLDVLVNNAGIAIPGNLESITLDSYDTVLNTNLRGVLLLTKLAMPYLIKYKGNVVNISSVAGLRPATTNLSYSMSKAALDQFTKCVALEVASKQVRVNSVNPGGVVTDFFVAAGMATKETKDMFFDNIGPQHPIGRNASTREISNAIAFLASDLATDITGLLLTVDGGLSIKSYV